MENKERKFCTKANIFEQVRNTLEKDHKFLIENYKIFKKNEDDECVNPEYYFNTEEKRRKVLKDENGYYNYIPIKGQDSSVLNETKESSIYSITENEYKFHPLIFKTEFCDSKDCDEAPCHKAHGLKDFRKIFELSKGKEFSKFVIKMEKFLKKVNVLNDYLNFLEIPTNFSLDDFKVLPCRDILCRKDPHLCYFYHNNYEKRRSPNIFTLENVACEHKFIKKSNMNENKVCPDGDMCNKFHSMYEFLYYKTNFRKYEICQRVNKDRETGKCEYYETCYGIHKEIKEVNYEEKYKNLKEKFFKLKDYCIKLKKENEKIKKNKKNEENEIDERDERDDENEDNEKDNKNNDEDEDDNDDDDEDEEEEE
jgi:hypothetical protein